MALFTPVGQARQLALTALRLAIEAITDGDTTLAAAVLEQVEPESPDNSVLPGGRRIGGRRRSTNGGVRRR